VVVILSMLAGWAGFAWFIHAMKQHRTQLHEQHLHKHPGNKSGNLNHN
jgi:hypothetical protein